MRRKRTRAGSRKPPGVWVSEPKIRGSKDERWATDLRTGKRRRLRATIHTGSVVNETMGITCPRWIEDDCSECDVCGERSNQVALGVTWFDGEQRVRAMNPDGGYRSRGPVLYAMHILKLERFVERHFECGVWALKKQGGQLNRNETLPQYLIWAYRFGTPDDLLTAVARALSAGVPKARIAKELGPDNVYEEGEYKKEEAQYKEEQAELVAQAGEHQYPVAAEDEDFDWSTGLPRA